METIKCETHGLTLTVNHRSCLVVNGWVGESGCPRCQEEYKIRRLLEECHKANIPPRFSGKGFDTFEASSPRQKHALEMARRYSSEFPQHLKTGCCMVFVGSMGTGKTHLGCAILSALVEKNYRVLYVTVAELIRNLRSTWGNSHSESDLFRKLARPYERFTESALIDKLGSLDLLLLDEVGVQYGSESERVQLSDLIDVRYQLFRPSVVISNCDVAGLVSYLGPRPVDRLKENGGIIVPFDWPSRRGSRVSVLGGEPGVREL